MIFWGLIAFLIVLLAVPFARQAALKYGFVDAPDGGRKTHSGIIPPVGGLVIIPTFVAVSLVASPSLIEHWPFWLAVLIVWGVSAIDDKVHINSGVRFLLQLTAAAFVVLINGTEVKYLGNLFAFGDIWLGLFSIPFSILCLVLLINAINMIDGLDGLCGGIILIMLGALITVSLMAGGHALILPMCILAAALCAFLVYNYRHPFRENASVFLGDSGSAALGLTIGWFVIELTQWPTEITPGHLPPVMIAWILALPVFDALSLFAYRLKNKRHPFSPDRRHLHYLLRDAGFSVSQSVGVIHALVVLYCLIGIGGSLLGVPSLFLMLLWIGLFAGHGLIIFGIVFKSRTNSPAH